MKDNSTAPQTTTLPDRLARAEAPSRELTKAQQDALRWLWPNSRRLWAGNMHGCSDPSMSALMALCRRGLATKSGSAGWRIYFSLTVLGLEEQSAALQARALAEGK